jgi:hypothetical protein
MSVRALDHCHGKEKYDSYGQAERRIKAGRRRARMRSKKQGEGRVHVYRCPSCSKWHVGADKDC